MTLLAWKPENQAVVAAVGVVTLFLVFISLRKSKSTKLKYHGIRSFPELRIEPKTFIQRLLPPAARMDDILGVLHTMVLDKEGDNVPVCRLGDNILFLNSYPVIREVLVAGQSNYSKCLNSVDRGPGITGLALWVFLRGDHLGGTVNEVSERFKSFNSHDSLISMSTTGVDVAATRTSAFIPAPKNRATASWLHHCTNSTTRSPHFRYFQQRDAARY